MDELNHVTGTRLTENIPLMLVHGFGNAAGNEASYKSSLPRAFTIVLLVASNTICLL